MRTFRKQETVLVFYVFLWQFRIFRCLTARSILRGEMTSVEDESFPLVDENGIETVYQLTAVDWSSHPIPIGRPRNPNFNRRPSELENVQKRAARFVTRNYSYETGSMTGILEELKWETLQKRRKDNRLILLYKGLKGKARIPTDDLIPKNRRCRNQHSLVFQIPSASIDAYKKSFFPQSIRDWNALPDSLVSSAEMSDDCVSKFTSLVRARD